MYSDKDAPISSHSRPKITQIVATNKINGTYRKVRRLNRQVRNYEKCLKNSLLGVEKLSFFRGLAFSFF